MYIIVKASTYSIATWVFNLKPNLCLSVDLLWLVNTAWILYQKFPCKGRMTTCKASHTCGCMLCSYPLVFSLLILHWNCLHWVWSNVYDTLIILFECGNYLYIPVLYYGYSYTLILIGTNAYWLMGWWFIRSIILGYQY